MRKMAMLTTTIDSFKFLWEQIEREARHLFVGGKDVLAVIGALYAARKTLGLICNVSDCLVTYVLPHPRVDLGKKYGPWAVVTGSSEGIGFSYAHELASRGLNVVLISRSEEKLQCAKAEIEQNCKVQVTYIVADFASDNQDQLYENIEAKLSDKEIGLLVNNVGMFYNYPDEVLNVSKRKLQQMININIGAATMMTHLLLPAMVRRGKGGVVMVSSASTINISPLMTIYGATKTYVEYFLQGLAYEYRHSGVTFQCLIPFYVATRMTGAVDDPSKHSAIMVDANTYARGAISTLGRQSMTTGCFLHTLQWWMACCMPQWLWMRSLERVNNASRQRAVKELHKQ